MNAEILTSIITGITTVIMTVATVYQGNKLTAYKIERLEERVNKHNNLIERTYALEKRIEVDENRLKVSEHRLTDLENEHNREGQRK